MTLKRPHSPADLEALLAHSRWVRKLAKVLAQGAEFADDTEQDAWRIALERPPAHGSNLHSWWSSVVRSAAFQRARSEGRHRRRVQKLAASNVGSESGSDRAAAAPEPSEVAERMETFQILARLVHELEEPFGSTLFLHYFEGQSVAAIAKQQAVPRPTVQSRLRRGLAKLRTQMLRIQGGDWRSQCLALAFPASSIPTAISLIPFLLMKTQVKIALFVAAIATVGVATLWEPDVAGEPPAELETQLADSEPASETQEASDPIASNPATRIAVVPSSTSAKAPPDTRFDLPAGKHRDAWLEFEILDADGNPWPNLPMGFGGWPSYASPARYFKTNQEGIVRFPCLSGPWQFSMISDTRDGGNGIDISKRLNLAVGETKRYTIRFPAWTQLSGHVMDENGNPLSDIRIQYWGESEEEVVRIREKFQTDENGSFQVKGIEGRYTFAAMPSNRPTLYLRGNASKDNEGDDLILRYPPSRMVQLTILDGDTPVAEAKVEYSHTADRGYLEYTDERKLTYTHQRLGSTDTAGMINIPAQADISWPVILLHPELGSFTIVLPAAVTEYTFQLPTGSTLRGRVLGPDGKPVVGAHVRAWGPTESSGAKAASYRDSTPNDGWPWQNATTDEDGEFELSHLPVSSKGAVLIEAKGMAYFGQRSISFPGPEQGLDFHMQPEYPIAGISLDQEDKPVEGITVEIQGHPSFGSITPWQNLSYLAGTYRQRTNAAGEFRFPGVAAGEWTLFVRSAEQFFEPSALVTVQAGIEDLIIHVGDGLENKINISGEVFDANTQKPISKFTMGLWELRYKDGKYIGASGVENATGTDSHRFKLTGNEVNEYVLSVSSPGFATWRMRIPAIRKNYSLHIELHPAFPLVVRLEGSEGNPISRMPVRAYSQNGILSLAQGDLRTFMNEVDARPIYWISSTDDTGAIHLGAVPTEGGYFLLGGNNERPSLEIPFYYQPSQSREPVMITVPGDFLQRWRDSAPEE
jgi:RNA polymerase sigma factor (sigma-70 family)